MITDMMCRHCKGWTAIVIGVLVLLNAYFNFFTWGMFFGWLLVLLGLVKLFMPNKCKNCNVIEAQMMGTGKKRR